MPVPFDINKQNFLGVLEGCHARLQQIRKDDAKRHIMDQDIPPHWDTYDDELLMPAPWKKYIYWEPTDDEINAPLHA